MQFSCLQILAGFARQLVFEHDLFDDPLRSNTRYQILTGVIAAGQRSEIPGMDRRLEKDPVLFQSFGPSGQASWTLGMVMIVTPDATPPAGVVTSPCSEGKCCDWT